MKSKMVLVAFLLMLFIAPMILTSSYGLGAIPTEPNMSKDFSLSADGDSGDMTLASGGNHTGISSFAYTDTHVKDMIFYYAYNTSGPAVYGTAIILDFIVPDAVANIWKVNVSSFGHCRSTDGSATTKDILIWDGSTWDDKGDLAEDTSSPYNDGSTWVNWTSTDSTHWTAGSGNLTIKFDVEDTSTTFLYVDYIEVVFYYPLIVDTVTIYFSVPLFTGALDAVLIFAGLIMIPASTLYLVKGGKDEMSSDKLFYGLIAFVLGWGLFLGGIFG